MTAFNPESDVTFCLTSCGRADLLKNTLDSFMPANAHALCEAYIIEDANSSEVKKMVESCYPEIKILMNKRKLGHMRSVDRVYESVKTQYIFHCEDDWLFDGREIISDCLALLTDVEWTHLVSVRDYKDMSSSEDLWEFGRAGQLDYVYRKLDETEWSSFTLNPTLIKKDLWLEYGPYAAHETERAINAAMKADQKIGIMLTPGACVHIGGEDHVDDPFQRHMQKKTLLRKVRRSLNKRFHRLF